MRTSILAALTVLGSVSLGYTQSLNWTKLHPPALGHDIFAAYYDLGAETPQHIVYLTDGGKWASETALRTRLSTLHAEHPEYPATRYVLIGTIDSAANVDHRQQLFGCDNDDLHEAFAKTLIPWAEESLDRALGPDQRTLVGLSLGAAHAATELTHEEALFGSYVLLSPITYDCPDLARRIAFLSSASAKTRRAYISTGRLDAETYAVPLTSLLQGAGVETKFVQTEGDHDFANWDGQWEGVLRWLYEPEL